MYSEKSLIFLFLSLFSGQRADYFKLYRAAMRVFAGLFHINGNLHYSAIEVYDDYLMTALETNNSELFDHLITRLCTNLKQEKFSSQSHDARHEESNKLAQNMFPGRDLEELQMAFTLVDDIYELRKKIFSENGINDRSGESNVTIPEYGRYTQKMRCDLRQSTMFLDPYTTADMVSIDGEYLNTDLLDIFKISRKSREADILNCYRYRDFTKAYNPRSKIAVLSECCKSSKTEKDIL